MRYFLLTFLCELPFFDRINSAYDLTPDLYCPILPGKFKHKITRKYPLRGYILGVLTHTTTLDRLWGGDETLK